MKHAFRLMRLALAAGLLLLTTVPALKAQLVTATFTVTNTPANGATFTINGSTFTWTNAVGSASQVQITNSVLGNSSNMFFAVVGNPVAGLITLTPLTNGIIASGQAFTYGVTQGASNWVTLALTTNGTSGWTPIMSPASNYPVASDATNVYSQAAADLWAYSTNALSQVSALLSQVVGLTNTQTISGAKTFNNSGTMLIGVTVSNGVIVGASLISGNMGTVSNGTWIGGLFTNGTFYGNGVGLTNLGGGPYIPQKVGTFQMTVTNAFAIVDTNGNAHFGVNSNATGFSYANGNQAIYVTTNLITFYDPSGVVLSAAEGANGWFFNAAVDAENTTNLFSGTWTGPNNLQGTNNLQGIWTVQATAITSLVNSNNADLNYGTNSYVQATGPTGAFYIAGILAGVNGQALTIENDSGETMVLGNQSGVESTAANRIITMTGADRAFTNAVATLRYDGAVSRWRVIGGN
jgi:hypothetical protein